MEVNDMSADYIVQVEWRIYFADRREGVIYETPYPSAARHMPYDIADAVCQRIRARGHLDSVVCDQRGNPVIAYDLEKSKPISEAQIRQFYDERVSESEEATR
jgi:hypothetical protein